MFKVEDVVCNSRLVLHRHNRFGKHSCNVLDHYEDATACYNKLVCLVASIGGFLRWIDLLPTSFHFKLLPRVTHRSHGTMVQTQPYLFIFLIYKLMCLDSRQAPCNYDAFKIHPIHDKETISNIPRFRLDYTFNSLHITFNFHLFRWKCLLYVYLRNIQSISVPAYPKRVVYICHRASLLHSKKHFTKGIASFGSDQV